MTALDEVAVLTGQAQILAARAQDEETFGDHAAACALLDQAEAADAQARRVAEQSGDPALAGFWAGRG